jgi:hypothetical protein
MAKKIAKPKIGQETKAQFHSGVSATGADFKGYNIDVARSYSVYREMRENPTVALARIVATAPIRQAEWTVSGDNGAKDEWIEFIDTQFKRIWNRLIKAHLYALDYGWAPFEVIWRTDRGKWEIGSMKHLLVDITDIQIDEYNGFAGLKQNDVELDIMKSYLFTHDGEAGNLYGRSRHENIRSTAYRDWKGVSKRAEQFFGKIAGVVPICQYPEGKSQDETGSEIDNFEHARKILANLGKGNGVAMPDVFSKYADEFARAGVDISKLQAWKLDFLADPGSHGTEFVDKLKHSESLMMRGWLVPERVALEGSHGTLAESGQHTDTALMVADMLMQDIVDSINDGLVNKLLTVNFGDSAVDTVKIEQSGISSADKSYFRALVDRLFSQSITPDFVVEVVELDQLLDMAGVPKQKDKIKYKPAVPPQLPSKGEPEENDINTPQDNKDQPEGKLSRLINSVAKRFRREQT